MELQTYLIAFPGHYLGGQMVVVDTSKEEAINQALTEIQKELPEVKKNELEVQLIDTSRKQFIMIDNGDY